MNFAKDQLSKHGWTEGQGLGKTENGITEAIKVKIKQNKTGVGHDPGEEFSYHWWDHVFNKAASKIEVKTTESGVEVKNTGDTKVTKKKNTKSYCDKSMLYGQFVKGATLSNGTETDETNNVINTEDNEESSTVHCLLPDQADKVFKMCGGRTAHKGARHGLKLNGKLQRIEEQEKLLLERYKSTGNVANDRNDVETNNEDCTKKKKKDKKRKRDLENSDCVRDDENIEEENVSKGDVEDSNVDGNVLDFENNESEKKKIKRRKKDKRNKKKDQVNVEDDKDEVCQDETNDSNNVVSDELNCDDDNTCMNNEVKKRKKSKKRKHELE
ncbi:G patch domain-containing protein 4 [Mactra antiquata]